MGLLDKARNTQSSSSAPETVQTPEINHNNEYSEIFVRIKNLANSIDYASNLFRILCETVLLEKAVLFYKSEEQENFLNLCSSGYDVTTNNRLRLDKSFFLDARIQNYLSEKRPFLMKEPSSLLMDYFSTREYGMVEEMYYIPIYHKAELIALILITEWRGPVPEQWISLFRNIAESVSNPLFNSRKVLVNTDVKYDETVSIDHEREITKLIKAQKDREFYFINLNLSHLMEELTKDCSGVTAINIKKEILSVFKTMSGGDVDLFELSNNKILLIQKKDKIPDIDLYIYQLSASLPLLYTNLNESPDLDPNVILYSNTTNLEELLKDLL